MHEYQKTARDFVLDRLFAQDAKGAGLFLDPGLGKTRITLEVLATLHALGEVKRTLIVAPLRVCNLVWPEEVAKWDVHLSTGSLRKKNCDADIELINYESLHKVAPGRYDLIVLDESTKVKNWSTKRMKSLRKLLPSIGKRIILTGTPAANSLTDLHAQIFCLDDGEAIGRNVTVFRSHFCSRGGHLGREWFFRPEMEKELFERIGPMVLRMDAETYLDMPELVTNDLWCELPPSSRREYRRLKEELLAQLESADILAMNSASAYGKMKQLCNGAMYDSERTVHEAHTAKLDALDDLVEDLGGKPVLVFFQYKHDAERIAKRLTRTDRRVEVLSKTEQDAAGQVKDWNDGGINVFLVQPQSAGHGLNLQYGPCADVAWFGVGDSPEVYDQAVRRVYRQGQKSRQIRVHRLLCRETVDKLIVERLAGKFQVQDGFFQALLDHARSG